MKTTTEPIRMKYEELSADFKRAALVRVHAILAIGFSTNKVEIAKDLNCSDQLAAGLLNEFAARGILEKIVIIPNKSMVQNLRYIYRLKRPHERDL